MDHKINKGDNKVVQRNLVDKDNEIKQQILLDFDHDKRSILKDKRINVEGNVVDQKPYLEEGKAVVHLI